MDLKAAEVKVVYKTKVKPSDRFEIKNSEDAYKLLLKFYDEDTIELKESFKVILLNQSNKVLGIHHLGEGGMTGVVADVRQILQLAILTNAISVIISHNHPSGNPQPSPLDEKLTNSIDEACKVIEVRLQDHIILTSFDYYSFADHSRI